MAKNSVVLSSCLVVILNMMMNSGGQGFANATPTTSISGAGSSALLKSGPSIRPPSISMTRKLYSRTKMFLQIDMNGLVSGTSNCSSKFVTIELLSVGSGGLKMIRGVASGRYLAMNNNGTVYSTNKAGEETVFKEKMQSSGYITYASSKYYNKKCCDIFVAIKRNGRVKPGRLTNKLQKPAHFLILPVLPNNC